MDTKTRLSVNINKVATIRNARGGNNPDVEQVAVDCERFGAQGITVHPRPDERHIRYNDVRLLKSLVKTEFNIEGYPDARFTDLVLEVKPTQVTLVPDAPGQITSNHGWDVVKYKPFLREVIAKFKIVKQPGQCPIADNTDFRFHFASVFYGYSRLLQKPLENNYYLLILVTIMLFFYAAQKQKSQSRLGLALL